MGYVQGRTVALTGALVHQGMDTNVTDNRVLYENSHDAQRKEETALVVSNQCVGMLRFFILGLLLWHRRPIGRLLEDFGALG